MPDATPPANVALPQRPLDPLAAVLSYLVPGLGQIWQGRYGKGVLFLVCLLGLFFFGMYQGGWRNVYIDVAEQQAGKKPASVNVVDSLVAKARFFGQFWIGVAAWPAVIQYATTPADANVNVAGEGHPVFGTFQRRPTETEMNDQLRNSDKTPDLGWTYTVIAGVLNILVIYDALAGAAFAAAPKPRLPQPVPAKVAL